MRRCSWCWPSSTPAGIWLLLQAEFLAIALVMVYVGAVMVLFLFVVMMLDINVERLRQGFWSNLPLGGHDRRADGGRDGAGARRPATSAWPRHCRGQSMPADYSNTKELGRLLFTDYVYPFELASVILLVAIIAAVMLTLRQRKDTKYHEPVRADQRSSATTACAWSRCRRKRMTGTPVKREVNT